MDTPFSARHGLSAPEREITIRDDAPVELRQAVAPLARQCGITYTDIRRIVCDRLLVSPDPSNWSEEPNIRDEVIRHLERCDWFRVYDILEDLYSFISSWPNEDKQFSDRLNLFFREQGIGWEMDDNGKISYRGSELFPWVTKKAVKTLRSTRRTVAASEIEEALVDISRRPKPDITGAVQHAMAALEAVVRDITGEPNSTLGQIARHLNLKPPLDQAIEKLWGYASNEARHGTEASVLSAGQAELIVSIASALCSFLPTAPRKPKSGR